MFIHNDESKRIILVTCKILEIFFNLNANGNSDKSKIIFMRKDLDCPRRIIYLYNCRNTNFWREEYPISYMKTALTIINCNVFCFRKKETISRTKVSNFLDDLELDKFFTVTKLEM